MNLKALSFPLLAATLASCAAPVEQPQEDVSTSPALAQALTLQECADQRDACFAQNPFFGWFTCPGQYTQCTLTASNGIPAQVVAAIADAADCADQGRSCRADAANPAERLQCTQEEAVCVAGIVDARIPQVVEGTQECVESAIACIGASESANDLAGCSETFEDCAVGQAVALLPPEVGAVVEDVSSCLNTLDACVNDASSASGLTQCSQDEISCVADSLGVPLVQPPVADAVHCAETGAQCALDAETASDVRACAMEFNQCNGDIVTQQLTCAQKWTQCLVQNPFNFFGCAADLATCTD